MEAKRLTRQLDIIPMGILGTPITIVGAGAIGSWTTMALAKMGFADITVYDYDSVEEVNLNAQVYGPSDIGNSKVGSLFDHVEFFTGVQISSRHVAYPTTLHPQMPQGVLIMAVDSMAARKQIWEHIARSAIHLKAFIDPRMGAEEALMYCMNPMDAKDQESYSRSLYSDTDAQHERCTGKATAYTALMLSGLVAKTVKDILTGDPIRTCHWSIKNNQFLAWTKNG